MNHLYLIIALAAFAIFGFLALAWHVIDFFQNRADRNRQINYMLADRERISDKIRTLQSAVERLERNVRPS